MTEHSQPLYRDRIEGGCHWSFRVKRGKTLRLIDELGGANVGMLFYNPSNYLERYNAPDTLKCQHTFKLTKGHCLYSDMGRIFCSITEDTVGWHDTIAGNLTRKALIERWGEHTYQDYTNDWTRSGHDSFLVELAKYGLGLRDMAANLNLFSQVITDDDGNMRLGAPAAAGSYVDLRFEMDTLVLFHTCPHPLSDAREYPKRGIFYEFYDSPPVAEDDLCKNSCPENKRGFKNTSLYNELHA